MTDSRAGSLALVGGTLALDFANTAAGRDTAEPVEHLRCADDLVAWAAHASGIDGPTARRCRLAFADDPALAHGVLRHARALREAVYGVVSAIARGAPAPSADLETLRGHVRRAFEAARLQPAPEGGYAFAFAAAPAEAALLGPVVWSAISLLTTGRLERLKRCPGEGCGWLFLDLSKNGSRRWCEMATCGNRAKARGFRRRR